MTIAYRGVITVMAAEEDISTDKMRGRIVLKTLTSMMGSTSEEEVRYSKALYTVCNRASDIAGRLFHSVAAIGRVRSSKDAKVPA